MRTIFLSVLAFAAAAAPARAASCEAASAAGQAAFEAALLQPLQLLPRAPGSLAPGAAVTAAPAAKTQAGFVTVSGFVTLNGSGSFIGSGPAWANVNLTGWVNVSDPTGQITSNQTYINAFVSVMINGQGSVLTWAQPSVQVMLYKNGQYVGSGTVTANIPLSGMASNGWVNLTGSGTLSGSVFVNAAPQ